MTNITMHQTIIDLTHCLNNNITVYPGTLHPEFKPCSTFEKDGFAELKMTMVTHTGTHIDAPSHIYKNAKSLDRFPIEKFTGMAIVIPCLNRKEIDLDYLKTFENKITQTDFIIFYTGWQEKWNTADYFDFFPTLSKEAAHWLSGFKLKGLGFDTISADKVSSTDLPIHHVLLEKEIIIIENLSNLDKLPTDFYTFQCIPLKIKNADGSPVRALAMIDALT
jgi:arylformamidase